MGLLLRLSKWTPRQGFKASRCEGLRKWQSSRHSFLKISEEVEDAIASQRPVVALESTIYTHGFPKPDNVSLAFHLESTVRQNGGVPATIGVLDGVARVGMSPEELAKLTSSAGEPSTLKLSRRDLSFAIGSRSAGRRFNGGTTVAGTMILAHLAGIKVFATGGLGGVHRGAESSMDISADLMELGRTPVAVVSSGCKSFLDIPRTLEYLETQGVGVATFADGRGEKVDFPSFWSRDSGVPSPMTIQDEQHAAAIIHAHHSLGLSSGLLFGSPIPQDHQIPKSEIDAAIDDAIKEAEIAGASGKDNTPFILAKIVDITRGRSLSANRALIETNVALATKVAIHLAELERSSDSKSTDWNSRTDSTMAGPAAGNYTSNGAPVGLAHHRTSTNKGGATPTDNLLTQSVKEPGTTFQPADIVVAGAIAVDHACDYVPPRESPDSIYPEPRTSNPAHITQSVGGVGRNVAIAAHYFNPHVLFCSAIAIDVAGEVVGHDLESHGLSSTGLKHFEDMIAVKTDIDVNFQATLKEVTTVSTAQYVAVNDSKKDLSVAMADVSILEKIRPYLITAQWIKPIQKYPKWLVLDTNWAPSGIATWLSGAQSMGATKVAVDPVSAPKSVRLFSREVVNLESPPVFPHHKIHVLAPNRHELIAMNDAARSNGIFETKAWWSVIDSLGIPAAGARAAYDSLVGKALVDGGVPQMSVQLLPLCPCIVVKLGEEGVLVTELLHTKDDRLRSAEEAKWIVSRSDGTSEIGGIHMRLFPATKIPSEQIKSVNGVGDTFLGTLVAGLAKNGRRVQDLIDVAQAASRLTLQSTDSVSERLVELKDAL